MVPLRSTWRFACSPRRNARPRRGLSNVAPWSYLNGHATNWSAAPLNATHDPLAVGSAPLLFASDGARPELHMADDTRPRRRVRRTLRTVRGDRRPAWHADAACRE